MRGFADGITRFFMLALAAMATFAIIGSFSLMSSRDGGSAFRDYAPSASTVSPNSAVANGRDDTAASRGTPEESNATATSATTPIATETAIRVPRPSPAERAALWLEVIAYTLIAIAGILAVIALVLMRASGHWRDMAER